MNKLSPLETLIQNYITLFEQGIVLEENKITVIKKNRISMLDDCMKQEQAFILKLRGYDRTRDELLSQLGFENLSFQELIETCNKEDRELLEPLYLTLQEKVNLFHNFSETAKDLIKIQLHNIEEKMREQGSTTTYTANKEVATPRPHFTSTKI